MVKFDLFHHHRLLRQILHRNHSKPQNTSNQSKVTATSNRHSLPLNSAPGAFLHRGVQVKWTRRRQDSRFPRKVQRPSKRRRKKGLRKTQKRECIQYSVIQTQDERGTIILVEVDFNCFFFGCFVLFSESPVTGHEPSGRQSGKGATEGPNGFLLVPGTDEISYNNNSGFPLAQGIAEGRD